MSFWGCGKIFGDVGCFKASKNLRSVQFVGCRQVTVMATLAEPLRAAVPLVLQVPVVWGTAQGAALLSSRVGLWFWWITTTTTTITTTTTTTALAGARQHPGLRAHAAALAALLLSLAARGNAQPEARRTHQRHPPARGAGTSCLITFSRSVTRACSARHQCSPISLFRATAQPSGATVEVRAVCDAVGPIRGKEADDCSVKTPMSPLLLHQAFTSF